MWVFHIGFASTNLIIGEYVSQHKRTERKQSSQSVPNTRRQGSSDTHAIFLPLWQLKLHVAWKVDLGIQNGLQIWGTQKKVPRWPWDQWEQQPAFFPEQKWGSPGFGQVEPETLHFSPVLNGWEGWLSDFSFCFPSVRQGPETGPWDCLMFCNARGAAGGKPGNQCVVGRMKWDNVC